MNRRWIVLVATLALGGGVASTANAQQWRVVNNLDEEFSIRVWPRNNPGAVSTATIGPGRYADLKLGNDRHRIQLKSGGGNIYFLKPTQLRQKGKTNLKTILTPNGRRNGKIKYQYMNQQGFDKSDYSRDIADLSRSTWDTKYEVVGQKNKILGAQLRFQGDKAKYTRGDFVGHLSNVRYRPSKNKGEYFVDGRWSGGGDKGTFKFLVTNRGKLDGEYWHGQTAYNWTGTRERR